MVCDPMRLIGVVLSGDSRDEAALRWAAAHVRARDVLDIVLTVPAPALTARARPGSAQIREPRGSAERDVLDAAMSLVRRTCPTADVRPSVCSGGPAQCRAGLASIVDLLVLGANPCGDGPDGGELIPADLVDSDAVGCPVVVVPAGWRPGAHRNVIVVPVTGALPRTALLCAIDAAVRDDAAVLVIEAFQPSEHLVPGDAAIGYVEIAQTRRLDAAVASIAALRKNRVPMLTEVVRENLLEAFAHVGDRACQLVLDAPGAAPHTDGRALADAALTVHGVTVLLVGGRRH